MAVFHSELNPSTSTFWLCVALQFFLQDWHCALRCFTMVSTFSQSWLVKGTKSLQLCGTRALATASLSYARCLHSAFNPSHVVDPRVTWELMLCLGPPDLSLWLSPAASVPPTLYFALGCALLAYREWCESCHWEQPLFHVLTHPIHLCVVPIPTMSWNCNGSVQTSVNVCV